MSITFDDLAPGTLTDDHYTSTVHATLVQGEGFTITASGGSDRASLYDSALTGGEDPDLEGPPGTSWLGGNLSSPQTAVGNVLIIQESADAGEIAARELTWPSGLSSQGPGNAPDDLAGGGDLTLTFERAMTSFAYDMIDVDDPSGYTVTFTDTATSDSLVLAIELFEDPMSLFYDPTIDWEDSHANRLPPITAAMLVAELGGTLNQFDQITFSFAGSGGIGAIYTTPEPGTGALVALGLAAVASRRRQQVR